MFILVVDPGGGATGTHPLYILIDYGFFSSSNLYRNDSMNNARIAWESILYPRDSMALKLALDPGRDSMALKWALDPCRDSMALKWALDPCRDSMALKWALDPCRDSMALKWALDPCRDSMALKWALDPCRDSMALKLALDPYQDSMALRLKWALDPSCNQTQSLALGMCAACTYV